MSAKTLDDILGTRRPAPEPETVELEPDGQQDVGSCGWVRSNACAALDIERGGTEPVVSFQYYALGVRSEFAPGTFWVEFGLETVWRVTAEGRNLRPLFDRLNDHRLRKLRQGTRDFDTDDGKPFVSKLTVRDVTPKRGADGDA